MTIAYFECVVVLFREFKQGGFEIDDVAGLCLLVIGYGKDMVTTAGKVMVLGSGFYPSIKRF